MDAVCDIGQYHPCGGKKMTRNEQEYLNSLRSGLSGTIPNEEIEDILSDYTEHFRMGRVEGRSDEDLCHALGSPDDVAREIKATYMVSRAEQNRSCRNIWHAVLATLGLGLFNLVVVLVPFIILAVLLAVVFVVGAVCAVFGPVAFMIALLQVAGYPYANLWLWPSAGVFFSIGITSLGLLLVIGDYYLARFFYHLGIRYLKWNIRVIKGTEETP